MFVLPTLSDMAPDLLQQRQHDTVECSMKLMRTLINRAKHKLELLANQIKDFEDVLEPDAKKEVKKALKEIELKIEKHEKKVQVKKTKKFSQDKIDYETGRIYTLAKKYDTLYRRHTMEKVLEKGVLNPQELVLGNKNCLVGATKLDFPGELQLLKIQTRNMGRREQDKAVPRTNAQENPKGRG
ncbi:hypothetical protein NDU88_005653 [Pleurodeles waltl]|uniref:Uncharacterized protein n=1 Tax=Pleurodeles waltl TaxID=8319 RepID=A0AAV7RJ72_PLEWA|nr:hypothetical protein NDU88_005653 [Pleurodeles waltl]